MARQANISVKVFDRVAGIMLSGADKVKELVKASILDDTLKGIICRITRRGTSNLQKLK